MRENIQRCNITAKKGVPQMWWSAHRAQWVSSSIAPPLRSNAREVGRMGLQQFVRGEHIKAHCFATKVLSKCVDENLLAKIHRQKWIDKNLSTKKSQYFLYILSINLANNCENHAFSNGYTWAGMSINRPKTKYYIFHFCRKLKFKKSFNQQKKHFPN